MALKRQQATEDAIAMGLRAVATGAPHRGYLPPGPIFGIPVTEPLVVDEDSTGHASNITEKENEAENRGEAVMAGCRLTCVPTAECKAEDADVEVCEASSDPLDPPSHRKQPQERDDMREERDNSDPVSSTVAASEDRSSGKGSPDTGIPVPNATSQRLTAGDLLARIFPTQRRPVLDLVLQACEGDVLKAIEHFLSLNDSIFRQQNHPSFKSSIQSGDGIRAGMQPERQNDTHSFGQSIFPSPKSAFTPLNQSLYPSTHMAPTRGLHMTCQQPPFPFHLNRDMLGNHFNPAVHFLLNQSAPQFSALPPVAPCPPGCTQCPPPLTLAGLRARSESSCSSAYKGPGGQDGAVDLTSDGQTSWRSSPSSSAASKRSE